MRDRIKIILVTGFLGSGKTTFLNRLIEYFSSNKIAVIVNDFGRIAVDGILLKNVSGENLKSKIYEIANGSIFCSCLSSELVKSLKYFVDVNTEKLIIETSGLSDPTTFQSILNENKLNDFFTIENSICIVDSTNMLKLKDRINVIEKQIASSDVVLVNKSKLVEDNILKGIGDFIRAINTSCEIIRTNYSEFDMSILEKKKIERDHNVNEFCNTNINPIAKIFLKDKQIRLNDLEQFFKSVSELILRLKGFLKIDDTIFYISNNSNNLIIEKYDSKEVNFYGLTVLSEMKYKKNIEKAWNFL